MSTAAQPQLLQLAAAEACSQVVWTLKGSVTAAQLDDAAVGRTVDIDMVVHGLLQKSATVDEWFVWLRMTWGCRRVVAGRQ